MKKLLLRILQTIQKIKLFKKIIAIGLKALISIIVITILKDVMITSILATLLDIYKTLRKVGDLTLPVTYQPLALLKMISQLFALFSSYFVKKVDDPKLAKNFEASCLFFIGTYLFLGGDVILATLYIYNLKNKK